MTYLKNLKCPPPDRYRKKECAHQNTTGKHTSLSVRDYKCCAHSESTEAQKSPRFRTKNKEGCELTEGTSDKHSKLSCS